VGQSLELRVAIGVDSGGYDITGQSDPAIPLGLEAKAELCSKNFVSADALSWFVVAGAGRLGSVVQQSSPR
jgi:hypothetical protein